MRQSPVTYAILDMMTRHDGAVNSNCMCSQVVPVGGGATHTGAGATYLAASGIYQAHKRAPRWPEGA